ncbi:hypothetical protein SAMN04488103_102328 [Gemmobacter aquatilis]|uniref:DUF1223 domain-containing protein n=1 Tax=Gemmobacter aquatilis TaxID=933059 RepID=A0A1H8BZ58_9RHOB|nr:DUF1223 domain-containing protein [Gemmobacter aquatilis]SEM88012.1 hypothetical protein SAMN04488103_102328 [Gemmobacter aquatilis]
MLNAVKAACGLWVAFAPMALAQQGAVVVEFYTSQGCSSCPPADAYFATLTGQAGVIPLALHVDYWDYIGWEDRFADPQFTARQKAYARAAHSRTIYTPQMIVQGAARVEGNDPEAVAGAIAAAQAGAAPVLLQVTREAAGLRIRAEMRQVAAAGAALAAVGPVIVQLVRYRPEETVDIAHGENAGQVVTYRNIVTSWEPVAEWAGLAPLDLALPDPGAGPAVVILQQPGPGAILAAAALD